MKYQISNLRPELRSRDIKYQKAQGKRQVEVLDIAQTGNKKVFIVQRDAQLTLVLLATRATSFKTEVVIRLVEPGATANILGFVVGKDQNQIACHTTQLHEAPETTSNLLVKSVLTDQASFTYEGAIRVEKRAQKTDAYQRNENLLLSSDAHAESKPALEILANDVRCTHGATVSAVSDDELWYMLSRGVGKSTAVRMITAGFFASALERISDTITRNNVTQQLIMKVGRLTVAD